MADNEKPKLVDEVDLFFDVYGVRLAAGAVGFLVGVSVNMGGSFEVMIVSGVVAGVIAWFVAGLI